jgi:hypothetical protein
LLANKLVQSDLLPVIPDLPGLRFQALHSLDAAHAYRLAILRPVSGAFNIAADPVLDARTLGELFGARPVRLPAWPVRAAVAPPLDPGAGGRFRKNEFATGVGERATPPSTS